MTPNETQSQEEVKEAPAAPVAQDPGKLSFADYQVYRRTGEMPKQAETEEAKSALAVSTPAAEQKEAEESGESAKEEVKDESEELEASADETEAKDESEKVESDKPKKKGGFQRRIDKLNQQRSAVEQERDYWKQQALKSASATEKTEPAAKVDSAPKASDVGKPLAGNFETHAEWVEAVAEWKADQKLRAFREDEQKKARESEQLKAQKAHAERVSAFVEKTPDWFDVMEELAQVPRNPVVEQAIVESDQGPELLYQLGKHPDEALRISKLTPVACARELGKFEAKYVSTPSTEQKPNKEAAETKKVTQAPKPLAPVGSGKGTPAPKRLDDPDLSFQDYVKLRRQGKRA